MDTLLAFVIASLVTMYFVRRYLRTLAVPGKQVVTAAPEATGACPRCGKPIYGGSAFCSGCGASMALWTVHRAERQTGTEKGEEGKPRPVINATLCIGCGSCVDACPETGTLALQGGKAILAHPDRCVGHAKCVEVCPTSAVSLSFGGKLQTLRAPLVQDTFETNVSGVYIAGELSGMGLIKTAINEGRLAIENIKRRLEAAGEWSPPSVDHDSGVVVPADSATGCYDVIIVGAGPAGLSASLAAEQYGMRYLTLEQGEVAATIRNYPRHKFLMAEPIEMPLYGNLYVGDGTKESLLKVWETIIANTGVRIQTQERVEGICRSEGMLRVETPRGAYQGKSVILAMGKRGTPRRLGVPGEELPKVSYRLIEADGYSGNDILVVGGGDSAIEAALAVGKGGRNRVTLSYRGKNFERARERNRGFLDAAAKEGRIRVICGSNVTGIAAQSVRLATGEGEVEIPNDYAFVMIGGESPEAFLQKIGVEMVEKAISV